jgi:hypothetical protein
MDLIKIETLEKIVIGRFRDTFKNGQTTVVLNCIKYHHIIDHIVVQMVKFCLK